MKTDTQFFEWYIIDNFEHVLHTFSSREWLMQYKERHELILGQHVNQPDNTFYVLVDNQRAARTTERVP